MALTKVTGGVVSPSSDYSINNVTGVAATFTGNVSIGGTLTYQDVSNIDAVGIITAQKGIQITGDGLNVTSGISTFAGDIDANADIELAGNLAVTGISTFTGAIDANGALDVDGATTLDGLTVAEASVFNDDIFINVRGKKFKTSDWSIFNTTSGNALSINGGAADTEKIRITSAGYVGINTNVMSNSERVAVQLGNDELFEIRSAAQELFQVWKEGSTEECRLNVKHGGATKIHLRGNGASYFNGGNFGIGDDSPTVAVSIKHTAPKIKFIDSDATGTPETLLDGSGGDLILDVDKDNEKGSTLFAVKLDGDEKLRINSSGDVGIGVDPASGVKLHIKDTSSDGAIKLEGTGSTLGTWIALQNNDATANSYSMIQGADAGGQGTSEIKFINVNNSNNEGALAIGTRPSGGSMQERLRIHSDGKVSIGSTVSGGWKFRVQVPANSSYQSALNITNNVNADINFEIKNSQSSIGPSTNTPLVFKTNNTERLSITGGGQVHIGNPTNNAINNALFKAVADDGEADELYVGQFINLEATAGHSFGVNIQAGSSTEDHGLRVKNRAGDATHFLVRGDGKVGINTTDARFNNNSQIASASFYHNDPKFGVHGSIVIGNLSATATDERQLAFYRRGGPAPGTSMSTHKMGRIAWYGSSNDTSLPDLAYSIECVPNGGGWTAATNRRGSITFNNHDSQVMRLTSTGNVLVGDHTSPLTNYQSNQTRLSIYDSASSGGYLELGGNNPNNAHSSGTILFINYNNADANNNDADGRILAMQRVENVTTDSNAGDDCGGDLNFMTKPDGGGLDERFRIKDVGRIDIKGESGQTGFHLSNKYGQAGIFGGMYYDGSAWVRSAAGTRKGAGMYVNTGGSIGFLFASENSGTSATMKEFVSLGEVHQNSGGITINGDASSTAGPIITLQDNVSTGTPSCTIMSTSVGGLIINADSGNDVNGSYIQFKQDNQNKWLMQDNDFKSSINGLTEKPAALMGSYHSENNTNHDGTVDCTNIKCGDFGILEVFGRVNPNTSGSGAYSDPIHMYIYHGIGWSGSVKSFIYCRHVAPPARDAYSSGTGSNGNNVSVVWYDGSSESTECGSNSSSHYVRFKLHGFNPTHGPNFAIRVFRRF